MDEVHGPFLLPPLDPNVCKSCAVEHDPAMPHSADSLHFQYWWYSRYQKWPSWADAMFHCDEEVQRVTREVLERHGIHFELDEIAGWVQPRATGACEAFGGDGRSGRCTKCDWLLEQHRSTPE